MKRKTSFANLKRIATLIVSIAIVSGILVFALENSDSPEIIGSDISGSYNDSDYIAPAPHYYDDGEYYVNNITPEPYYHENEGSYEHEYNHAASAPYYNENENGNNHSYATPEPYYNENEGSQERHEENDPFGNVPDFNNGSSVSFEDFVAYPQYNDCDHPIPCYCHIEYWPSDPSIEAFSGYISISPLSEVTLATVHNPAELALRISQITAGTGNAYVIPIAFPNNGVYTNTIAGTQQATINILGGVHVILDSANASVNQVWNRNQTSGRHFAVSGGGILEIRNVTLSRSADWVLANPNAISGGVSVTGSAGPRSHLIMNHQNATISNNRAQGGNSSHGISGGGAVGMASGARFIMHDGNIINNVGVGNGGAIFMDAQSSTGDAARVVATINGGRISGNIATISGGAFGMCCNSHIILNDGRIYNNTSEGYGGTGHNFGGGAIHLGTMSNNRLDMYGGSIGHPNPAYGNVAAQSGGGVFAPAATRNFVMHGGAIYHNISEGTQVTHGGGGVFIGGANAFTFNGGVIGGRWDGGNLVPAPNRAQRGGGVFVPSGITFTITGSPTDAIIMSNHAYLYGGGVFVGGTFVMAGGTIGGSGLNHGNTAGQQGGGVFINTGAVLNMNEANVTVDGDVQRRAGSIIGNRAAFGGGIQVLGTMNMQAGSITGNTATNAVVAEGGLGGGIHLGASGAVFNMTNGAILPHGARNITGNNARLGGGVHFSQGAWNISLTGMTEPGPINITNNTATDGGGVWLGGDRVFTLDAIPSIYNNTATGAGGGFFVGPDAELILNGGTIGHDDPDYGNTAQRGGGVSIEGTFRIQSGYVIGNSATGATVTAGLGGGIHANATTASFIIEGSGVKNIRDNSARLGGGVHWSQGAWNIAANNTGAVNIIENNADFNASSHGGGVHWSGGTWTVANGSTGAIYIDGNHATQQGGGMHISGAVTWPASNNTVPVSITNNTSMGAHSSAGVSGGIHMARISSGVQMGSPSLTLNSNWLIYDNTAMWTGGGITASGYQTQLILDGGMINDNRSLNFDGGGVDVRNGATFTMLSGTIQRNIAGYNEEDASFANGGGVNVTGIYNVEFDSETGTWIQAGSTFNMWHGIIHDNHAPHGGGGGVHLMSNLVVFNMHGGEISENTAGHAGGVWLQDRGVFNMYNGLISDNIAGVGRGSHSFGAGLPVGTPPNLVANRHGSGGGVNVCCMARFYMHGGTIDGNTARVGGGLYLAHGGRSQDWNDPGNFGNYIPGSHSFATIFGGTISGNTATVDADYYYNVPFAGHEFDGDGGGIFITASGILTFEGTDPIYVNNNTAEQSGGGIRWMTGHWNADDNDSLVEFIGNTAAEDGGGIYVGGGIYITNEQGQLEFVPGHLVTYGTWHINNNAATRGGGVFVGGGFFTDGEGEEVPFASHFELEYGGVIANNTASTDGGGIFLYDGVNFTMNHGTTIRSNAAVRHGGGVYLSDDADFTMLGGVIGGGRSFITNPDTASTVTSSPHANTATRGAGVFVGSGATFTMDSGTAIIGGVPEVTRGYILGNNASVGGGGVAVIDSHDSDTLFTMRAGVIAGNVARGSGGGTAAVHNGGGGVIVVGENARFNMEYGTIDDNAAPSWSGGGVTVLGEAEFLMEGGFITNNMARVSGGGGVAVRHYATFIMDGDGTISNNTSIVGAGVLSYNRGMFIMEDGLITGNFMRGNNNLGGGGLGVIANAEAVMNGGTITGHNLRANIDDGGGVWVGEVLAAVNGGAHFEGDSVFTMNGGYIIDNFARRGGGVYGFGSVALDDHSGSIVNFDGAGGNDWLQNLFEVVMEDSIGITPFSTDRSRFIMTDGYIEDNEAAMSGGGVHVTNGFVFYLENEGVIIDNEAAHDGGGVWVGEIDTAFAIPGISQFNMSGGTITENEAGRRGGGVFLDGIADIIGGEISENIVINAGYVVNTGPFYGSGGGIYVTIDGVLSAEDVDIIGNHASQMGGGIFTELHQYSVPILSSSLAYSNLTIEDTVFFDDNTAGRGAFTPPANAYVWTDIPGQAQSGTQSIFNHPINNYDINWRRGDTVPFRFHKANEGVLTSNISFTAIGQITPFLLEGAYFTLFRFIGTGTPPDHAYAGSALWEVVYSSRRSTGNIATPIVMGLTPESIYQLVEVHAPAGYQVPFGQWRIVVNNATPGGFNITEIGAMVPEMNHLGGYFYVGNRRSLELPMSGGLGANMYLYSGFGVILLAIAIMVYFYAKRRKSALLD